MIMPVRFQVVEPADDDEEDDEAKKKIDRRGTKFEVTIAADGEEPVRGGRRCSADGLQQDEQSAKAFEEESRIALQSTTNKKRALRELRQNELEAATVQLVKLAQKNTQVLPVDLPAEKKKGVLGGLGNCCLALCAPRSAPQNKNKRKTAYESGLLWKLNSGQEQELKDDGSKQMLDLKSWRRRLFFVLEPREHLGDVAVVYISEKQNGQVHLVALLSFQGVPRSSVEELPSIAMNAVGRDSQFRGMSAMKQYDVALLAPGGLAADEDYEPEVPRELFPFAVTWRDAAGSEQRCVLAGTTAKERQKWTLGIRVMLARMQQQMS